MEVVASDDFSRPDSTDLGPNWTEVAGDWAIVSNSLRKVSNFGSYWTCSFDVPIIVTPEADYDVQALAGVDGGDNIGEPAVLGRYQNSGNFYACGISLFQNYFQIYKLTGGSYTQLDSYSVAIDPATTYTIRLSMEGSTIRGFLNGVERCSAVDTDHTATGKAGVLQDLDGAAWVTDFEVYGVPPTNVIGPFPTHFRP